VSGKMVKYRFHQYQVVGRSLPTPTDEHPKIFRMKPWATNEVLAKSKFCVTDTESGHERIPQNLKRKFSKQMRFYANLQETQQALSATKSIAKKRQRRKRNISGQTFKDLSSLAESLPIFSDKKSVPQINDSAKFSCKSRQKLVAKETKQLAAVLAHPVFVSNPFSAVQQHLENTLGPQINTESRPKHANKEKSSKGSKKKNGSKASPSCTVRAMEL